MLTEGATWRKRRGSIEVLTTGATSSFTTITRAISFIGGRSRFHAGPLCCDFRKSHLAQLLSGSHLIQARLGFSSPATIGGANEFQQDYERSVKDTQVSRSSEIIGPLDSPK